MRGLLSLMLAIPFAVGCVMKTIDEDEDDDWDGLTGVWALHWDSAGAMFVTSCESNGVPDTYFSVPIHNIEIGLLFDNTVLVNVGGFPEEYPCDLGEGAQYIGACLDENPYSTRMEGELSTATSFTASKHYGGMNQSTTGSFSYTEWELEISGDITAGQLQGEANMRIIDGDENDECRSQVKQTYTAEAQ